MSRISETQRYNVVSNRVEKAKNNNAGMLEQISTQKIINRVSDDPVDASQVMREKGRMNRLEQFIKSIGYAKGFLERTETAVEGIHEFLMRGKELAVAMSNGTYGPESRLATSRELAQIIQAVTSLGNSSFGGRYVFGGFRSQTPPVSKDGQYVGDDGGIFIQTDEETFKRINLGAREMFQASHEERESGHFDLIHSLNILYTGLKDDDMYEIRKSLEELDHQLDKVSSFQARLGAIYNSLSEREKANGISLDLTRKSVSELEDADMFKSTSDFKRTETVLQSTLMASNKLLQPSLLNFLQ